MSELGQINFKAPGKRAGYRGFISFILCFARLNYFAKKTGMTYEYSIRLPIKWFL